ncbi:MAG: hypothetical protein L6R38_009166 [Xanthoria sp. 2 TBL-2021]|nr:MAG: hypothetical protein L6R38_009166 [Xanthoria sp. 2 TBL-2021]
MSVTSTDTVVAASNKESIRFLGSSIDSLSPPRQRNSHLSNIYKEASTLFLTRRLAEAYSTLEPILTLPEPSDDGPNNEDEDERTAPIATASRSLRVKVWSLYLTLLNAIIQLGPEQGKQALGSKQWHEIAAKARDGTVWDEVVQMGYGGIEGNVDADVVTNLATLLLSHSTSQTTNQQYLETYLATSDLSDSSNLADSVGSPKRRSRSRYQEQSTSNGTNTPRELASRLKILELYILHVLPANDEWEYAKEFIQVSETLDDERKDIFQQALSQLEAEKTQGEEFEEDCTQRRDQAPTMEDANQHVQKAEPKPVEEDNDHPHSHRRSNSEQDYGIEELKKKRPNPSEPSIQPSSASSVPRTTRSTQQRNNNNKSSPSKLSPRKSATNSGILARSAAVITAFQNLVSNMTLSMSKNPLALLRFVLFLVALLVALSRRDVKDRVVRITGAGWEKVKRTVGMGVKVSYI